MEFCLTNEHLPWISKVSATTMTNVWRIVCSCALRSWTSSSVCRDDFCQCVDKCRPGRYPQRSSRKSQIHRVGKDKGCNIHNRPVVILLPQFSPFARKCLTSDLYLGHGSLELSFRTLSAETLARPFIFLKMPLRYASVGGRSGRTSPRTTEARYSKTTSSVGCSCC